MELLSRLRAETIGFAPPEKPGNTDAAKPDSYASVRNFTNFIAVCQPFEGSDRDFLRFVHISCVPAEEASIYSIEIRERVRSVIYEQMRKYPIYFK
jgi:hypothetical protein